MIFLQINMTTTEKETLFKVSALPDQMRNCNEKIPSFQLGVLLQFGAHIVVVFIKNKSWVAFVKTLIQLKLKS